MSADIGDFDLIIFDAQARALLKYDNIKIPKTLDLRFLNAGIYFISFKRKSDSTTKIYKFFKQ